MHLRRRSTTHCNWCDRIAVIIFGWRSIVFWIFSCLRFGKEEFISMMKPLSFLRETLFKTEDDKNYGWTKVAQNPSRIHKTTENMILYKDLMFIFSLLPYFPRYRRSKNDHARLSYRISFMSTCSPYARVSANFTKICTFLRQISVAIKCSASVSAPISSSVWNNVSLN